MNHTLYPEILLPVTAHIASLVLAGATCMGYINFNENLLQLQLQLHFFLVSFRKDFRLKMGLRGVPLGAYRVWCRNLPF